MHYCLVTPSLDPANIRLLKITYPCPIRELVRNSNPIIMAKSLTLYIFKTKNEVY